MVEINYNELQRGKGMDKLLYRKGESTPYTGKGSQLVQKWSAKIRRGLQKRTSSRQGDLVEQKR